MKKTTLLIILLLAFVININAQDEQKIVSGNSITFLMPQDALGDAYDNGFGIYANFDYNFSKYFVGRFDLGWNSLNSTDLLGLELENQNVWEFSAGARARISLFYAEIMGGYYTGFDSWGYKPAIGIRWKKLDFQANVNYVDGSSWVGLRLGYYWGKY